MSIGPDTPSWVPGPSAVRSEADYSYFTTTVSDWGRPWQVST
jgi:hypothetical protein